MKNVPGHDNVLDLKLPIDHKLSQRIVSGNVLEFRSRAAAMLKEADCCWVLKEAYEADCLKLRVAVRKGDREKFLKNASDLLTAAQEDNIEKRLRDLGVLEAIDNIKDDTDTQLERND